MNGPENHMHEHDHETEMNDAWESGAALAKRVREKGPAAAAEEADPGSTKRAMSTVPDSVGCIDERGNEGAKGATHTAGCAGCGCMIPGAEAFFANENDISPELQQFFDACTAQGKKKVFWHPGCGAAKNFAGRIGRTDVDAVAKEWAEKVANKINAELHSATIRPEGFHVARAAYWDATVDGRFNSDSSAGFLRGFHISESLSSTAQASFEIGVATSIAFDKDHGFGNFFSHDDPFIIIIVAHTAEEADARRKMLEALLKDPKYTGRVEAHTMLVPKP